ncbi:MAG TPA: hypothetical protein VN802_11540 [Stellaceae bacterium]|nr:hypothetical protein [Stellaceae bacterium]
MNSAPPFAIPPRVPAVEPDLLASAIFLFGEYLAQLAADTPADDDDADDDDDEAGQQIETAAVLSLFAEELGTSVPETLTLYMRVTALYRLLAASPSLARIALDPEEAAGTLTDNALVAASRLDLYVTRHGDDGAADFDPREFREALIAA